MVIIDVSVQQSATYITKVYLMQTPYLPVELQKRQLFSLAYAHEYTRKSALPFPHYILGRPSASLPLPLPERRHARRERLGS